jgi:hypothetical protein
MKHPMSTLVAGLAFFIACTESTPIEMSEFTDASRQTAAKAIPPYQRIRFDVILSGTGRDENEMFEVSGTVLYVMNVQDIEHWSVVQLNVITFGHLWRYQADSPRWQFGDFSYDEVIVSHESDTFIEKRYSIADRDDGMALRIRFQVRRNGIEIQGMWLQAPGGASQSHIHSQHKSRRQL